MIQLFLILIVGWVGHKAKVFPAETQTALTKRGGASQLLTGTTKEV